MKTVESCVFCTFFTIVIMSATQYAVWHAMLMATLGIDSLLNAATIATSHPLTLMLLTMDLMTLVVAA